MFILYAGNNISLPLYFEIFESIAKTNKTLF